ncbi:hypothetical protein [Microcystis phage Mel-JY01]
MRFFILTNENGIVDIYTEYEILKAMKEDTTIIDSMQDDDIIEKWVIENNATEIFKGK